VTAGAALQANIRAETGNIPLESAAGMRFAHAYDVVQLKVRKHGLTGCRLRGKVLAAGKIIPYEKYHPYERLLIDLKRSAPYANRVVINFCWLNIFSEGILWLLIKHILLKLPVSSAIYACSRLRRDCGLQF
jgi:hypothetical protein